MTARRLRLEPRLLPEDQVIDAQEPGRATTRNSLLSAGQTVCVRLHEDRTVIVDGNLVTARRPSDLSAFMRELMKMVRVRAIRSAA